jgi:hypothetical protein
MMDFLRRGLVLAGIAILVAGGEPAWAGRPAARPAARPFGIQRPHRTTVIDNIRRIDINNINMFVTNYGSFAWDLTTSNPGLLYPKGTTKSAVFAGGLWLGATVDSTVRTVVSEYSQEYGPGAMVGTTFDDPTRPEYRTYKMVRYTNASDSTHLEREANEAAIEDPLVHHSWSEYMAGAAPFGAPTRTYRLPITETANSTDSVDIVGPDVTGDMMLWAVYNDADPDNHTNDAGNSPPLGVEIQQSTFAFNRQGALGNVVFLRWMIINKGGQQLDSMFVSIWSDTDLGGAADDLVGVDVPLSLGYTYNSTNNDQLYGGAPPAVGYDFFQGPRYLVSDTSPAGLEPLPMTSFNKYINGTDPTSTSDTYNYMNGFLPDGSEVIDPTTGLPTKFFHPGDPTTGSGWLDSNPADRRHLLSAGPFYMSPGDTQVVVGALIIGNGTDRLSSISAMRFYDEFAQLAFDEGFQLPSPPPQPDVTVSEDHQQVTLCWDNEALLNYNEPGYAFEGYNVYQGASIAGPWKRLATYDLVNGILTVRDTVFDLATGQTINDFPVAFGTDAGLRFCYTATEDAIRGGPLRDATEYFFAVTAYAVSSTEKLAVVENAQEPIRVMPQRPAAGTDPTTAGASSITYRRINTTLPPTTAEVSVVVTQPDSVTGHVYKVVFLPLPPESVYTRQVGADTATVRFAWALIDSTTGDTLYRSLNVRGDEDYFTVHGIQVRVAGAYFPQLQAVTYRNLVAAHRRALEGVNWSGNQAWFQGGGGYPNDFLGPTSSLDPAAEPDSFFSVELRFSATATQNGYRYLRKESTLGPDPPATGRAYAYAGFRTVPFQAWDIVNDRQVDIAFVENVHTDSTGTILSPAQQATVFDSTWTPDASSTGGREYLFILGSTYSPTERSEYASDDNLRAGTQPQLYALWSKKRASSDIIDPGDRIDFVWANPATANDEFVIETARLQRGNATLAQSGLERIRAVPNPYYNRSRYEITQFARVIRFVNMPEVATLRIFNLSGDLVRTLRKTDQSSSVLEWNLLTDNQLPVASGIYIFHVEAPGVGETIGKMAVFMEKERLNNF